MAAALVAQRRAGVFVAAILGGVVMMREIAVADDVCRKLDELGSTGAHRKRQQDGDDDSHKRP